MANIHIFGNANVIPQNVLDWIYLNIQYKNEFIIGDRNGFDKSLYMTLSRLGALDSTTIYCMGVPKNGIQHNKLKRYTTEFDFENKVAVIKYEEEVMKEIAGIEKEGDWFKDRSWCEFLDRQMIKDCEAALCVRQDNGDDNIINHMIQLLNIWNRPTFLVQL